jgi:hypothetical protein
LSGGSQGAAGGIGTFGPTRLDITLPGVYQIWYRVLTSTPGATFQLANVAGPAPSDGLINGTSFTTPVAGTVIGWGQVTGPIQIFIRNTSGFAINPILPPNPLSLSVGALSSVNIIVSRVA